MKRLCLCDTEFQLRFQTRYMFLREDQLDRGIVSSESYVTLQASPSILDPEETYYTAQHIRASEICTPPVGQGDQLTFADELHRLGWRAAMMYWLNPHAPLSSVWNVFTNTHYTSVAMAHPVYYPIAQQLSQIGIEVHLHGWGGGLDLIEKASRMPIRSISTNLPLNAAQLGVILHPELPVARQQEERLRLTLDADGDDMSFPGILSHNIRTCKTWLNRREAGHPAWL